MNLIIQLDGGGNAGFQPPAEVKDKEEIFFNGNHKDMEIAIEIGGTGNERLPQTVVNEVFLNVARKAETWSARFRKTGSDIRAGAQSTLRWSGTTLQSSNGAIIADFEPLRKACQDISEVCYLPAFRHVSSLIPGSSSQTNYFDMRVGRPFIDEWREMQTGRLRANRERIYSLIEEIRQVFGFEQLQISSSKKQGDALQLMIDGRPFDLQDLGAGLSQFILTVGTAALRNPTYILVDEPELSLHPSLQVTLIMKPNRILFQRDRPSDAQHRSRKIGG